MLKCTLHEQNNISIREIFKWVKKYKDWFEPNSGQSGNANSKSERINLNFKKFFKIIFVLNIVIKQY